PVPGTPSRRTWPRERSATRSSRVFSSWATTTEPTRDAISCWSSRSLSRCMQHLRAERVDAGRERRPPLRPRALLYGFRDLAVERERILLNFPARRQAGDALETGGRLGRRKVEGVADRLEGLAPVPAERGRLAL